MTTSLSDHPQSPIRLCGVERVCEKCERAMLAQLETQCRPQVGYTARTLRKVPWRILSR